MTKSSGYAARAAKSELTPIDIDRRAMGAKDVLLEITYWGLCQSDVHAVDDDMGVMQLPIVPGHVMAAQGVMHRGLSA